MTDVPLPVDRRPGMHPRVVWLLIAVPLFVLALGAAIYWKTRRPAPDEPPIAPSASSNPDPRLTYATSYRNVSPDAKYVGDEACASCHVAEATTFHEHPMGGSAAYVSSDRGPGTHAPHSAEAVEHFDRTAKNPFEALGFEFLLEQRGKTTVHKVIRRDTQSRVVAELGLDVFLAIGSGAQGRSYIVNRDGYFFQSPISWFTDSRSWGLSPGFEQAQVYFSRPITDQCLFCHVDRIAPVPNTAFRYELPLSGQLTIGCERCHGPGELHVRTREEGKVIEGVDETIVNPAHLEPALREAVCQQCHLMGEERVVRRGRDALDYRPGLPLHLFLSTFVRSREMVEGQKSVSHVEQMVESRCYRESIGQNKLGCISCHDPHQLPTPDKRVSFYRERCLACHAILASGAVATAARAHDRPDHPLKIRHAPKDDCLACHMPRGTTSNVAHEAITDHRIVRYSQPAGKVDVPGRAGSDAGQFPLVDFYRDLQTPNDREVLRDFAIACVNIARRDTPEALRQALCQRALPLLNKAIQIDPDDIVALEAKSFGLWVLANPQRAFETFETVLGKVPQREVSRKAAAELAAELKLDEKAIAHFRQLLATNPWYPEAHYSLAKLLAQHQDWPGAIQEARAALSIEPTHLAARTLLIAGYLQSGERTRAQQEFEIVERLSPPHLEKLRAWFKAESR